MKMLVIDDQMTTRMLLRCMLEAYGEVVEATTGSEAVTTFRGAIAAGRPFGMVCVDLGLPDIDGNEVLERLRAAEVEHRVGSPATIVMVTGTDSDAARDAAAERSADAFLTKPLDYEAIFSVLSRIGVTTPEG